MAVGQIWRPGRTELPSGIDGDQMRWVAVRVEGVVASVFHSWSRPHLPILGPRRVAIGDFAGNRRRRRGSWRRRGSC